MTTTINKIATNNLTFKNSKTIGNEIIYVSIKLNDECKNGHQDFSITGDIYTAGKPKIDRYHISGGCIHDEILKAFPEYKIFIDLHLCDYQGIPMYAVENGFYHLTEGFNDTKPDSKDFKLKFCEYYRVSKEQFDTLFTSKNKLQYAIHIQNLRILSQWKDQADKAIKILENLTDSIFLVDSKKTQFNAPTTEEIKEEKEKEANGYYSTEAQKARELAKQGKLINDLMINRDKKILDYNNEFSVKVQVLEIGGEKALQNCIWYNHTKTLGFNWKEYDKISDELFALIANKIKLPEGSTITNKS